MFSRFSPRPTFPEHKFPRPPKMGGLRPAGAGKSCASCREDHLRAFWIDCADRLDSLSFGLHSNCERGQKTWRQGLNSTQISAQPTRCMRVNIALGHQRAPPRLRPCWLRPCSCPSTNIARPIEWSRPRPFGLAAQALG